MVKHYHHHYNFSYYTSLKRHIILTLLILTFIVIVTVYTFNSFIPASQIVKSDRFSLANLIVAAINTVSRLTISYVISFCLAIPLALLIVGTKKLEKILLPLFDILQSVPVLAFFPIVVLIFLKINFYGGAAIFILVITMLWSLIFSMIGGLKTIPEDINSAAYIFNARGIRKIWYVTLPAIFPQMITGSLLSWASGWNVLIVAEVLHTYIPNSDNSKDLVGLGSMLVNASYEGRTFIFISSLVLMIILIGLMNFFIWQKLLHLAERYKFD